MSKSASCPSCPATIPPSLLRAAWGCTRTFSLETLSFLAGFVWAAPQYSEAFSCPRAHIRLPLAAGLCWGLDVAPQLRKLPGSMLPANGKNVFVIVLACSQNSPAVSGWAQAAYCRMLRALSWAECLELGMQVKLTLLKRIEVTSCLIEVFTESCSLI